MYEMCSGLSPFGDISDPTTFIRGLLSEQITIEPYLDEISPPIPPGLRRLIVRCTQHRAEDRPTADQAYESLVHLIAGADTTVTCL